MANKTNGSTFKKPGELVCEFHENRKNEKSAEESKRDASRIKIQASEIERGYKRCCLTKTEETSEYYRNLDNFELFDMQKSAEIIKGDIDKNVAKDGEILGKSIKEASGLLNDLQVKLHNANNTACVMRNCLKKNLGFEEDDPPTVLKNVTNLAKTLSEDGKKAAEAMVMVAGIHTYSNLETLQSFGAKLMETVMALKSWNDGLIDAAKKEKDKAQDDLTAVLEELNAAEFEYFGTTNVVNALDSTLKYICEGECQPIECVEEICNDIGKCESEADEPTKGKYTKHDED